MVSIPLAVPSGRKISTRLSTLEIWQKDINQIEYFRDLAGRKISTRSSTLEIWQKDINQIEYFRDLAGRKISTRSGTLRKEPDLVQRYLPDLEPFSKKITQIG